MPCNLDKPAWLEQEAERGADSEMFFNVTATTDSIDFEA